MGALGASQAHKRGVNLCLACGVGKDQAQVRAGAVALVLVLVHTVVVQVETPLEVWRRSEGVKRLLLPTLPCPRDPGLSLLARKTWVSASQACLSGQPVSVP